jgi:hypothetical protein
MAECHQPRSESTVISGHTRDNRLQPCQTSPSSAIQDISVYGHMRRHCLRSYKTPLSPALRDSSLAETYICNTPNFSIHLWARNKFKRWSKMIPIVASLKLCKSKQGKSTTIDWGWPSITKQTKRSGANISHIKKSWRETKIEKGVITQQPRR